MATASSAATDIAASKDAPPPSSADLEMTTINPPAPSSSAAAEAASQPQPDDQQQEQPEPDTTAGASEETPPRLNLTRLQSEAGLGPATESPIAPPPLPTSDRGPVLSITLMLTTGARHPYKIDEKYLRSRKVENLGEERTDDSAAFDPREISGYKLKELIWTDWRSEWEPRPASPSSIRLIILGRLVEDKAALKDFPFKLDQTNVVHMTVKPADFLDDDDTGGKGTGKGHSIRGRDDGERGAGCRCVIL